MKASKAQIKHLHALKLKKYRQKYNKFVAEGEKIALEILRERPSLIEGVFALPEWLDAHAESCAGLDEKTFFLTPEELKKVSSLTTPNQVVVLASMPEVHFHADVLSRDLVLFLDQIQDPGNLGTILRIADWFAIPWVLLSPGCVDPFNPKVIQASMGAVFRVKTWETTLSDVLQQAPDTPGFATVLGGENIFTAPLTPRGVIIIGNESSGISEEVLASASHRISIPAYGGGAESLNAAVAAGIVVAVFRQKFGQALI